MLDGYCSIIIIKSDHSSFVSSGNLWLSELLDDPTDSTLAAKTWWSKRACRSSCSDMMS